MTGISVAALDSAGFNVGITLLSLMFHDDGDLGIFAGRIVVLGMLNQPVFSAEGLQFLTGLYHRLCFASRTPVGRGTLKELLNPFRYPSQVP